MTRAGFVFLAAVGSLSAGIVLADDVRTAFAYRGMLVDSRSPVADDRDFEYTLWDVDGGGRQIGPILTPTVTVTDAQLSVSLGVVAGAGDDSLIEDCRNR